MVWETRFGSVTLLAIEDGWFHVLPTEWFPESDPAVWAAHANYLTPDGRMRLSMGCFLMAGSDGWVMVDSGRGGPAVASTESGTGQMPAALRTLGVDPSDIRKVIHTHLHIDHFGGNLTSGGRLYFPNAQFYVHQRELDYWTTGPQGATSGVREQLAPIIDAGRLNPIDRDTEVAAGITMIETEGHTPGHVSVVAMSDGQRTFITGDVTHHPLQADHVGWNSVLDVDPPTAAATRSRVFDSLDPETLVAAGHYPRPGLGNVIVDDNRRRFIPTAAVARAET